MDDFKQQLAAAGFSGELDDSVEAKEFYSHDASLFEVVPQLVVMPKNSADVQKLVKLVAKHKKKMPQLSLTARSAGTDMSGGAVNDLQVVFADGNEYTVKALNRRELVAKMGQKTFEGRLYKRLFELCERHYDEIKAAKPKVSKNSMGYNLWDVWDRDSGEFHLEKLIVGAQGTLGFTTDIKFRLVPRRPPSGLLVLFLRDIDALGEIIPRVLGHKPATMECFDDATLLLSIKFMPYFLKMLGLPKFIHLLFSLIPDGFQLLRGIPKMVLMVEVNGQTEDEVRAQVKALHRDLKQYRARYEINGFEEDPTEGKSEKFWIMRRHAFNLLRKKVKEKHTAPFIDDLVVNPEHLTEFLPKIRRIIK